MMVGIEVYWHDGGMRDDGVEAEVGHEGRRKHSRLILLLYLYKNLVVIDEMVDAD